MRFDVPFPAPEPFAVGKPDAYMSRETLAALMKGRDTSLPPSGDILPVYVSGFTEEGRIITLKGRIYMARGTFRTGELFGWFI